jgi:hypothetical protein
MRKLSRFLLSTSVGMIAILGTSEVSALFYTEEAAAAEAAVVAKQNATIEKYRLEALNYFRTHNSLGSNNSTVSTIPASSRS